MDRGGSGLEVAEADPEQGPAAGRRRVTGIENWRSTGTAVSVGIDPLVVEVGRQEHLERTGTGNLRKQTSERSR